MKDEKVSVKSLVVFAVLAFLLVLVGIFVIIGPKANDDRYLIEIPVKAPLSNSGNSGTAFLENPCPMPRLCSLMRLWAGCLTRFL